METEKKKETQDKAKIEKLKKGIAKFIKEEVATGRSYEVAEALAHIEARKIAVKTLGYIPRGFWKDKE